MNVAGQNLDELYGLSFGYLSGADLELWCDPQLLISALRRNPRCIQKAVNTAVSMVSSALQNIYDLRSEYMKQDSIDAQLVATATVGAVTAVTVQASGTNYSGVPGIAVTPVNGGAGAVLTAVVSPSVVAGIDILDGGCRYKTAPTVVFEGGGGNGATATSFIDSSGQVYKVTISNGGNGWTSVPSVRFESTDGYGVGARAVAYVQYGKLTGVNITNPGAGYTVAPLLKVSGGQSGDDRNPKLVMLTSIWAIRVLLGNAAAISEVSQAAFKMCDELLHEMKGGIDGLPLLSANRRLRSSASTVTDKYNTKG